MTTEEKKQVKPTIGVVIEENLLERLDNYILNQEVPPSRSAVICRAIADYLDKKEVNN